MDENPLDVSEQKFDLALMEFLQAGRDLVAKLEPSDPKALQTLVSVFLNASPFQREAMVFELADTAGVSRALISRWAEGNIREPIHYRVAMVEQFSTLLLEKIFYFRGVVGNKKVKLKDLTPV